MKRLLVFLLVLVALAAVMNSDLMPWNRQSISISVGESAFPHINVPGMNKLPMMEFNRVTSPTIPEINIGDFKIPQVRFNRGRALNIPNFNWGSNGRPGTFSILLTVLLGYLVFQYTPARVGVMAEVVELNPIKAVVYGLIGYVALILATIVLGITIIGIPLIPLLWLGVSIVRLVGHVALAVIAGRWLAERFNPNMITMHQVVAGLIALGVLASVPLLGSLFSLFTSLLSFGAVVWTGLGRSTPVIL